MAQRGGPPSTLREAGTAPPSAADPAAAFTAGASELALASKSPNTRRAYAGALRRLRAWLGGRRLDDAALEAYLAEIYRSGAAAATAAMAVAAVNAFARARGVPTPAGPRAGEALAGFRREAARAGRGRGQAKPASAEAVAAILATAAHPRRLPSGRAETAAAARRRGLADAAIAAVLFQGGLRRSEAAALRWADVSDAGDGEGLLLAVRTSKTNRDGAAPDTRYLKGGCAAAVRALRAEAGGGELVLGGLSAQGVGRRFAAAAAAAGHPGLTAHSGRAGLASELVARGASTAEVMLAGNWRTARMVAHYASGATAERGAVAKYL